MRRWAFTFVIAAAISATVAARQGLELIDLPAATQQSAATGINARGDIVGNLFTDAFHGFLLPKRGPLTLIDVPGAEATFPWAINARGDIVGVYLVPEDSPDGPDTAARGFLRSRSGRFTTIRLPGQRHTAITGINSHGTMVGVSNNAFGEQQEPDQTGFVLERGVFRLLPGPNAVPMAIADDGTVVGNYRPFVPELGGPEERGFVFRHGVLTDFRCPGTEGTLLHDVRSDGTLLGIMWSSPSFQVEGFVHKRNGCQSLGPEVRPDSINASGSIVGMAFDGSTFRAFIWRHWRRER